LQYYGSELVEHLNRNNRHQAEFSDIAIVESKVLEQATYYFRNIMQSASEPAQAALIALTNNQTIEIDKRTRRWLKRRCLLTDTDQLLIPLLGTWIHFNDEL